MSFYSENRVVQEMTRELLILRSHNINSKNNQSNLLLPAEGCLTLVAFERFLRMVLNEYSSNYTLYNLLELAVKRGISINAKDNQKAITTIKNVRNSILHANYEQIIDNDKLKKHQ